VQILLPKETAGMIAVLSRRAHRGAAGIHRYVSSIVLTKKSSQNISQNGTISASVWRRAPHSFNTDRQSQCKEGVSRGPQEEIHRLLIPFQLSRRVSVVAV
jgi:hypothetical protein